MKHIASFDLDKTLYNNHSFFEIVKSEIDDGLIDASIWDAIQNELKLYKSGVQDYSTSANNLLGIWVSSLSGKDVTTFSKHARTYFEKNMNNFFQYFEEILPKLRETHDIYIVTTNAQFVANAIVDIFNLEGSISTEFEIKDGKFTGKILKSLADGKSLVKELILPNNKEFSIGCGDSENDISMLNEVDIAVCMAPDDNLKKVALEKSWYVTTPEDAAGLFNEILEKVIQKSPND